MTKCLFSMDEMVMLTGARIVRGEKNENMTGFCIDSRKAEQGLMFVPLAGDNTDGHRFLEQAVSGGCSFFLCSEAYYDVNKELVTRLAALCGGAFVVSDPLKAMQQIAAGHVARFPYLKKIGITGSNGKTTVRRLVAAVLSSSAKTVQTEGNLNSEIGLPMSVLSIDDSHEYAVFEMGINHSGEMKALAEVFKPRYGVFTNIGTAHIGLLGSIDNIAAEKREMLSFAAEKPVVFAADNEPYAAFLSENSELVRIGDDFQKINGCRDLGVDGYEFDWQGEKIKLHLAGRHNLANVRFALAVADYFGLDRKKAAGALSGVMPMFGRAEIIRGDFTVIQDCYNANPESMQAAIDFLEDLESGGNKILVLGEMRELGDASPAGHKSVAAMAAAKGFDALFFFGDGFLGCAADEAVYTEIDKLAEKLEEIIQKGDLLFLKGSRGVALERISEKLKRRYSLC